MKNNSQRKKDSNLPLRGHLETRSEAGEEIKGRMPVDAENHVDSPSKSPRQSHGFGAWRFGH